MGDAMVDLSVAPKADSRVYQQAGARGALSASTTAVLWVAPTAMSVETLVVKTADAWAGRKVESERPSAARRAGARGALSAGPWENESASRLVQAKVQWATGWEKQWARQE